jgi:hypothetical protein
MLIIKIIYLIIYFKEFFYAYINLFIFEKHHKYKNINQAINPNL